ncbi:MAG: transposase, partial [Firmicutes bacterium]|nr:transposase [Bacillota bacterium]
MYQVMAVRVTDFANRYLSLDKKTRPKTSREAKQHSDLLPSAVLNQAIRDIASKKKAKHFRRLWPSFNSQNFRVEKERSKSGGAAWKASFPTLKKRVGVPIVVAPHQEKYLDMLLSGGAKQGSARLVKCGKAWYIHLSLTIAVKEKPGGKIMGIDLGLIALLVATIGGHTLFFSGGRLACARRRYSKLRRRLQKAGAHRALVRL